MMRQWTIEGADSATGEDRILSVEAMSREDAEQFAREQGILVSEVHESVTSDSLEQLSAAAADRSRMRGHAAPVVQYATPAPYRRTTSIPEYEGITKGARLLKSSASTYAFMAFAAYALAVLCVVGSILAVVMNQAKTDIIATALISAVALFAVGIGLQNRATMIRLQAELALATRDIARNSFK
jgi:hypothetical protein